MRVAVIDNYDSFTYNLVGYLRKLTGQEIAVFRNDKVSFEELNQYSHLVLSPGPGLPSESGLLLPIIRQYAAGKALLGVCLGHQAIAEVFGARLMQLSRVVHGKVSQIHKISADVLFDQIPAIFPAGRYHSWVVDANSLPPSLQILARDEEGLIMAIRHHQYRVWGVQFHPESIMTPVGEILIKNFLNQ